MQSQRTDSARSKEEICLDALASGRISIDPQGRIWKHWRMRSGGKKVAYPVPQRADHPDKLGYCRAGFRVNGQQVTAYAHRLVWVATHGPIPDGKELNHKDGDKTNNALSNLELTTHGENAHHAYHALGKNRQIHKHCKTKLTQAQADEIRRLYAAGGVTYQKLGKQFGVSGTTVRSIVLGLTWNGSKTNETTWSESDG